MTNRQGVQSSQEARVGSETDQLVKSQRVMVGVSPGARPASVDRTSLYPARELPEDTLRCCGRKPMRYKTPPAHYFCPRCNRAYGMDARQVSNWAWKNMGDGYRPTYPAQEYTTLPGPSLAGSSAQPGPEIEVPGRTS